MVAPDYLHLSGMAVPLTFWGSIALAVVLILSAVIIALRAEQESPTSVGRWGLKRMWPQYLMVVCGIGFFVGLIAFLQLNVSSPTHSAQPPLVKEELGRFYLESDALWRRLAATPHNISDADYKRLQDDTDEWSECLEAYIKKELGPVEASRLLEISRDDVQIFHPDPNDRPAVAQDRAATRFALNVSRKKLSELIARMKN